MRRSKIEMYMDILRCLARENALRKTHIMYRVNVNYRILSNYLLHLIRQGLVDEKLIGNRRTYGITTKGLNLVRSFDEIEKAL